MSSLVATLLRGSDGTARGRVQWHDQVASQLESSLQRLDLSEDVDLAWSLLGWAELCASRTVQTKDPAVLRLGIEVLAFIDSSQVLDGRDVRVVGGLFCRACELTGIDLPSETSNGDRGSGGSSPILDWLQRSSGSKNTLHHEVGKREDFWFVRRSTSVDLGRLLAEFGD